MLQNRETIDVLKALAKIQIGSLPRSEPASANTWRDAVYVPWWNSAVSALWHRSNLGRNERWVEVQLAADPRKGELSLLVQAFTKYPFLRCIDLYLLIPDEVQDCSLQYGEEQPPFWTARHIWSWDKFFRIGID